MAFYPPTNVQICTCLAIGVPLNTHTGINKKRQGIETVRRDGCPLLVKMLEKVLRLLFTTRDLSQVKGYLYRQWTRILTDRAAVGDFIFAKEVCLRAKKWM